MRVAGQPGDCTVRAVRAGSRPQGQCDSPAGSFRWGGRCIRGLDGLAHVQRDEPRRLPAQVPGRRDPDPAWPVNGLSICGNLAGTQNRSMLVSDDDGGVIVVGGTGEWTPPAALASTPSASPRRLDRGRLAGEWNLGVRVPGGQAPASRVHRKDGTGGFFVVWSDGRSGDNDIYAQRILADGTIAPGWLANGNRICGPCVPRGAGRGVRWGRCGGRMGGLSRYD